MNLNHVESYESLLEKTKKFIEIFQKINSAKVTEKVQFDDMKTTMNTAIESYKPKPTQSSYQTMFESREINESFWNHMEDLSLQ